MNDPYEDSGEGYGVRASRDSEEIVTTYGGWMSMLRVALVYGWLPEGGSYYGDGGRRIVSSTDSAAIGQALDAYLQSPGEAFDRWLAYVRLPKVRQARIFPMGDEEYNDQTKMAYAIEPETSIEAELWRTISTGGRHAEFARRLSNFCALGEFRI